MTSAINSAAQIPLQPLTIKITASNSKGFKSIGDVEWNDIPPFAVLTGPNGSGKTQLLQVIAYALTKVSPHEYPTINQMRVTTSGDTFVVHEIAYLPSAERPLHTEIARVCTQIVH